MSGPSEQLLSGQGRNNSALGRDTELIYNIIQCVRKKWDQVFFVVSSIAVSENFIRNVKLINGH